MTDNRLSFVEELKRHGVPVVMLVVGGNGYAPAHTTGTVVAPVAAPDPDALDVDEDDVEVVPPVFAAPVDPGELEKLRAQVQKLTAELAAKPATAPGSPPTVVQQVPAGDHGKHDDISVEALGLEDEALAKKLIRTGYETIGKLRVAFLEAKLAEAGYKKDWLIDIGMKLAGATPSGSAPSPVAGPVVAGGAPATDVPAGHTDRPWMERLAGAKEKQRQLDDLKAQLASKLEKVKELQKAKKPIPESIDDEVVELEDQINNTESQTIALRWAMNLDPDRGVSLDEALKRANLGPWMDQPQPRLAPGA